MPRVHQVDESPTALSRGCFMLLKQLFLAIHAVRWDIQLWQLRVSLSIALPYMADKVFFPFLLLPNDMLDSKLMVGGKPGDSSVVIWYQAENTPGQQNVLLLEFEFTPGSRARCRFCLHPF